MLALITGGSGSGKSAYAENLSVACHQSGDAMIYIATMYPFDEESHRRIARHREMRKDKNFDTVECFTHLSSVRLERPTTVLLECMSNLTANEVFQEEGAGERTVEAVMEGVKSLAEQAEHQIIVSNELFSDGIAYDPETDRYLRYLGEINRQIGGIDMLDTEENDHRGDAARSFSDIAVLYRTHRQAAWLERSLRQEGIPYVVAGREDFLMRREVRAALAFFRFALYPEEEGAGELARRLLCPLLGEAAEERFAYLASKYEKKIKRTKPVRLLEEWMQEWEPEGEDADAVMEDLNRLADMAVLYPTMEAFLDTLDFGEDGDVRRNGGRKFQADAVTLMTLHGSKGLEFPVVILYGMEADKMPLQTGLARADIQEERRLCFVGMTRAVEELILTCTEQPSPFLSEIPQDMAVRENAVEEKPEAQMEAEQLSLFDFM